MKIKSTVIYQKLHQKVQRYFFQTFKLSVIVLTGQVTFQTNLPVDVINGLV